MTARWADTPLPLSDAHVATAPPEARGLERDEVRLMVAGPHGVDETTFHRLPSHLEPGDLLVVNTSPTMPAAVTAARRHRSIVVHLSTLLDDGRWVVEMRRLEDQQTG